MADNRQVTIDFSEENGLVHVRESFDAEEENAIDLQRAGWQAILDHYREHVEA
jgi:hypothetical protein